MEISEIRRILAVCFQIWLDQDHSRVAGHCGKQQILRLDIIYVGSIVDLQHRQSYSQMQRSATTPRLPIPRRPGMAIVLVKIAGVEKMTVLPSTLSLSAFWNTVVSPVTPSLAT